MFIYSYGTCAVGTLLGQTVYVHVHISREDVTVTSSTGLPPTHYPLPITPHSFAPCSCALEVLGAVYESHGRMVGTLLHETVTVLIKALKTVDLRSDIFAMLRRLVIGLGPSSSSAHKDLYKALRNGLGDKNMAVRSAAAKVT